MPTLARAASISAAAGIRPSRFRNPQQRLSGVVVMSKASSRPATAHQDLVPSR
jgi:hypothetical protein